MEYDVQQICLNGHQITAYYHQHPNDRETFCGICGEKTTYTCQKCNKEIQGGELIWSNGVLVPFSATIPEFCRYCRAAFPWTERTKELEISADSQNPIMVLN
jgi:hypothetical protein